MDAAVALQRKKTIKFLCIVDFSLSKQGVFFVTLRHINDNNLLVPLTDEQISFERVSGNGTSVVMQNPQYKLHSTLKAIKRNLLKIFPLVNEKFKIHLIRGTEAETIENFDK